MTALELVKKNSGISGEYETIAAPIVKVTVTEDQADILRESELEFREGPLTLLITHVTPYVIDSTLWADVITKEGMKPEIGSIRAVRWLEPFDSDFKRVEIRLTEAVENLLLKIEELFGRNERLLWKHSGLSSALAPTITSIVEEVAQRGTLPERYEALMKSLLSEIESLWIEDYEICKICEEYGRELDKLREEWTLSLAQGALFHRQGAIMVSMESKAPGKGIIQCGYQVPCAQWRPLHEAHLLGEEKVQFTSQGVVWQNSGEEWSEVELTLSTAKPSLGLDAVLPGEDVLRLREKTREERRHIRISTRDQLIQSTGVEVSGEPPLPSDGGETQLYRIPEKVTIPSNGRPHLIKLEQFTMVAETAFTAIPELDCHVFLLSQVKNTLQKPILAGPITLHRGGTFIGTGQMEFAGSNESFHIWWGSEDLVRVSRHLVEKEEDATLFAGRRFSRTVTIQVRNLSGEEMNFRIQERIPVSEIGEVRVKLTKPPDNSTPPDKNGFIFIDVTAGGREEKKYEYSYVIETDKEVEHSGIL